MLFVCGYGVGSSAMAEALVKKGLIAEGIRAQVRHTAVGEMNTHGTWTDIVIISKKLSEGLTLPADRHLIEVVNIMDGAGIARQVGKIVDEFYPNARV